MAANPSMELFSPDDLQVDSTSFAPFLNRARSEREQGRDVAARIALGASQIFGEGRLILLEDFQATEKQGARCEQQEHG